MYVFCLDLEGVLFPEIWLALADRTGIEELRLTTRDVADYSELMRHRLRILGQNGIGISEIHETIEDLAPLEGARAFLDELRGRRQVFIVSDTFYEFWRAIAPSLGAPGIFCNQLIIKDGRIEDFRLRQANGKKQVVSALKSLNFQVAAAGDSHNDIEMLRCADAAALFRAPSAIQQENSDLRSFDTYSELLAWEQTLV